MSRKDYVLIADVIRGAREACLSDPDPCLTSVEGVDLVAYLLSGALLDDNPRFDAAKFLAAAGVR